MSVYLSLTFEWAPCLVIGGVGGTFAHENLCNVARGSQVEENKREHPAIGSQEKERHHWDEVRGRGETGSAFRRAVVFRATKYSGTVSASCIEDADRPLGPGRVLPPAASADSGPIDVITRTCGQLPCSRSRRFRVLDSTAPSIVPT